MKSSTIRRSTLSRETMEVIENLAKEQEEYGLPNEYVRPDEIENNTEAKTGSMSQEIDLLWQNFKPTQFNTNSPAINLIIGIVIGVISTLLVMFCLNSFNSHTDVSKVRQEQSIEQQATVVEEETTEEAQAEEPQAVSATTETAQTAETTAPSSDMDTSKMTKYIVKSGDTVENIIKNHYGSYSEEKAQLIMKANNLSTLDRINIDQEILLP